MPGPSFTLIVPAAGAGRRLGTDVPKPFLDVEGKILLQHTVERFSGLEGLRQVVIATSEEWLEGTKSLATVLPPDVRLRVVKGGAERQDSVFQALNVADPDVELVAVHDAARPFVQPGVIRECLEAASRSGAAIVGIPVQDTIKKVGIGNIVQETLDRKVLWQAQTPQVFRTKWIRLAYEAARQEGFSGTDDASLVERLGKQIVFVRGDAGNFKITRPADLELARLLLAERKSRQGK